MNLLYLIIEVGKIKATLRVQMNPTIIIKEGGLCQWCASCPLETEA